MKYCFLLLLMMGSIVSHAQTEIKPEEAKDHIGDSVKVEGRIYGVKIFEDDDKKPTLVLLNLGADYPNQSLTIAVYPSYKTAATVMPDNSFKAGTARVVGKIELYKGKPQIVVRSSGQMSIYSPDATVPKQ